MQEWSSVNFTTSDATSIGLVDNGDNTSVLTGFAGQTGNVTLAGRTLVKGGMWNTLCLPFTMSTLEGSVLADATIMELDVTNEYSGHKTGFDSTDGTLYLYFKTAGSIEAGKPYIVKWTEGQNIVNPVFEGVKVVNSSDVERTVTSYDEKVAFKGNYSPVNIGSGGDNTLLYLGANSTLYYPSKTMSINACRAYFQLNGIEAGTPAGVRAFRLSFGEDDATGIHSTTDFTDYTDKNGAVYDLEL